MSEQNSPAQPPAGATPAGSETVGQAPAPAEALGQASAPAEAVGEAPAEAKAAKKRGGIAQFLAVVLILVLGGGVYWFFTRDQAQNANVGDCLGGGTSITAVQAEDLKIMGCGEPTAWFKVVEQVKDKTKTEAMTDSGCTDPTTINTYWYGKDGEAGTVLCLAAAK